MQRILIVEDEPFTAMDLEAIVTAVVPAVVVKKASVASTKDVLDEPFDFAFLDVDVTNGKTYEIAQILGKKRVPFAFVSGSLPADLPQELRGAPFIPKPFRPREIVAALKSARPAADSL
jgi:DNA-binding LytR/AlgR family response regulator